MQGMRGSEMFLVAFAVLAVVVAPVLAGAATQASWGSAKSTMLDYGSVEGRVIALDLRAKTMQVAAAESAATGPVTVTFSDKTKTMIRQGVLHRSAADIHVGEDVDVRYAGSGGKWVADSINIRGSSVAVAHYAGMR